MEMGERGTETATAPDGFTFTRVDFSSYGTPTGSCHEYVVSSCHAAGRPGELAASQFPGPKVTVTAVNGAFGDP